jgi:hypothetical protein
MLGQRDSPIAIAAIWLNAPPGLAGDELVTCWMKMPKQKAHDEKSVRRGYQPLAVAKYIAMRSI